MNLGGGLKYCLNDNLQSQGLTKQCFEYLCIKIYIDDFYILKAARGHGYIFSSFPWKHISL